MLSFFLTSHKQCLFLINFVLKIRSQNFRYSHVHVLVSLKAALQTFFGVLKLRKFHLSMILESSKIEYLFRKKCIKKTFLEKQKILLDQALKL